MHPSPKENTPPSQIEDQTRNLNQYVVKVEGTNWTFNEEIWPAFKAALQEAERRGREEA